MSNVTLTWILFVSLLCSCGLIHSTCADLSVEGKAGDDVTLQCQGTEDFTGLKWKKPDLKSNYYVYIFRDGKVDELYQHKSFKDRVELKDPNMKNRDASVILKNITINDTGTYECYVGDGGSSELISRVTLTVHPRGDGGGHTEDGGNQEVKRGENFGLIVGLSVFLLIMVVVLVLVFLIYRKLKRNQRGGSI